MVSAVSIHIYIDIYSRAGKFSLDYYTVLVFISHSSSRLSPQLATTVAATLAMLGTLLLLVLVRYLPLLTITIMIHCYTVH